MFTPNTLHDEEETQEKKQIQLTPGPYELLLKKRILWLNTDVNDEIMGEISAKMLLLAEEDPEEDIVLFINSPGGSISSGLMLYDVMNLIPNDIITVATGMAASMGQFLLTVGAPGKRFITPNARVLLHQPLGGIGGNAISAKIEAELILKMKKQLAGVTASRTGKTIEQVIEDGDRDNWFSAEESLEYGFVDHIIENLSEIQHLSPSKKTPAKKSSPKAKTSTTKKTASTKDSPKKTD